MERRQRYQEMRERTRRRHEINQTLLKNREEAYILDAKEMQELWLSYQISLGNTLSQAKANLQDIWKTEIKGFSIAAISGYLAGFFPAGQDAVILAKLAQDMKKGGSYLSKYTIKAHNGKTYIILKGYPGLRSIFTGTRYLANNSKVIQMGIGKEAVKGMIKSGGVFTLVLLSAYRVADYFIRDEATWHDIVGGMAVDIVKVGVTISAASLAMTGTALMVSVAIGPLVAAVFIGTMVAAGLEVIDYKYNTTTQVIETLRKLELEVLNNFEAQKREFKQNLSTSQGQLYFIQRFFRTSSTYAP
ncbi:multipass membrane protein [Oleiphilus messinensis]|uniref:Multipass membrane protein n=1 Tax=Oleiphilus messinensis TaxID=141451 RepID=A0A1Y0IG47_9GAMM|nr:hypothetical protein [Oleiphilus messinensis]ARU59472.1 multipass membrane protein [Oleiphilus messinensis]